MNTFRTQDRETGTLIDEFETAKEAELAVEGYEEQDREEGNFKPNYYEVAEC